MVSSRRQQMQRAFVDFGSGTGRTGDDNDRVLLSETVCKGVHVAYAT